MLRSIRPARMNVRTIGTLLGAPLCAAIVYLLYAYATYPAVPPEYAMQPGFIFVTGLALAGIFEVLVLCPMWYVLRAANAGARVLIWSIGIGIWFIAMTGFGFLLGHGSATAVAFAVPFLVPGVAVCTLFAALMEPRTGS